MIKVTLGFEVVTLKEAFALVQRIKNQTTREIATEMGMNASTVWRGLNSPTKASGITLTKLVKWSGIDLKDFEILFGNEMETK